MDPIHLDFMAGLSLSEWAKQLSKCFTFSLSILVQASQPAGLLSNQHGSQGHSESQVIH